MRSGLARRQGGELLPGEPLVEGVSLSAVGASGFGQADEAVAALGAAKVQRSVAGDRPVRMAGLVAYRVRLQSLCRHPGAPAPPLAGGREVGAEPCSDVPVKLHRRLRVAGLQTP